MAKPWLCGKGEFCANRRAADLFLFFLADLWGPLRALLQANSTWCGMCPPSHGSAGTGEPGCGAGGTSWEGFGKGSAKRCTEVGASRPAAAIGEPKLLPTGALIQNGGELRVQGVSFSRFSCSPEILLCSEFA